MAGSVGSGLSTPRHSWIHLSSGIFALVGLSFAHRRGKYHRDGSSSMIPGHSLPMAGWGF